MNYLKPIIEDLLGTYTPVISTLQSGEEVVQYDVVYIVTAIVFIIVLWSVLRIIGGILCNR